MSDARVPPCPIDHGLVAVRKPDPALLSESDHGLTRAVDELCMPSGDASAQPSG